MQTRITVLPNPKRKHATDLIVRLHNGMIVACNNWPTALRLLENENSVRIAVAQQLVAHQPEERS